MPPINRAPRLLFWLLPLLPIALGLGLFVSHQQVSSFLALNEASQILPNWAWAAFTYLGNGWGLFAIAFPLLIFAPRALSAGIFAGALTAVISSILKPLLSLPRPSGVLAEGSFFRFGDMLLSNSMPSGHTLTAFAVATAIFFCAKQTLRTPLLLLFLLAILVGISRSALGVHWLSDVLVAAGLGFWCGLIGAYLADKIPRKQLLANGWWPRFIALGGLITIYILLNTSLDFAENQYLQNLGVMLIFLTLIVFGLRQKTSA
ncbi:phosphatase PAP2 family protein [Polynucleobacter sp. IMCC 30228]|uniref:phosphatase PAP2 family protein n=1 Tax=Polynucleobacter sp. IMCC 30228 TaxID=2781011 RepID=UPI001F232572|nr:phosphatase PAP2 family protein [Polynucleobacter sp. IMCC 30228]MCE7526887.1 phosphatase PAP2 family protein [Polynucleobacter sp. IMCC 30228]